MSTSRSRRTRLGLATLVAGLLAVAFTVGWLSRPEPAANGTVYQQARLFEDVLTAIRRHYVDSISETDLYFRATKGIVEHLNDPFSTLLADDRYRRYNEQLSGNWDGLGLQLDLRSGKLFIASVTPGSPAERDGLQTGDQLLAIDSVPTKGLNLGQATEALRGDAGTSVMLHVRRGGSGDPVIHRVVRAPIHVPATTGVLLDDGVGIVTLSGITSASAEEFRRTVDSLRGEGMTSLVIDLRHNRGGFVKQGVAIADLLLHEGQSIGTLQGRTEEETQHYAATRPEPWPGLPIAALVNGGTASAAEIIAGALQDHDRAVVVGTPTYGKGAVQSTVPLGREIALKLTTAHWRTPSGRSVQRPVQLPKDEEIRRAAGLPSAAAPETRPAERWLLTDNGRAVRDASGVEPDVVVREYAGEPGAALVARALGGDLSPFYDAVETLVAEQANPDSASADSVLARLRSDGFGISDEVWRQAQPFVTQQLDDELARRFGGEAELRRRVLARDAQLQAAVRLVTDAGALDSILSPPALSRAPLPRP